MKKLFGTDGIRGVVGKDLTIELCFRLGRVFGMMVDKNFPPGLECSGWERYTIFM